jgi:ATP-binding cassette subfamily B protein
MALSVAGTAVLAIRTGSSSLDRLVLQISDLHQEALFVGDYERLCQEAAERAIPATGESLPPRVERIRFEQVTFTYPGEDNAPSLKGVDLTIPTGKIVALVGSNGSGKSTLVKLLCGLYTPDAGRILWNGTDAAAADRAEIFRRVAIVAQDFYRWPFTARVNVGIGQPSSPFDDEDVTTAARQAGADKVIADLPRGLNTLLARGYKGGHQISGGQWQRIGIARARYRGADILIVDEPTSALDAQAEKEVFDQIRDLAESGQTIILITHRLHSVQHADEIYVLDKGEVAEHGTFAQLMHPDTGTGAFRDMYLLQSSAYQHTPLPAQHQPPSVAGELSGEGA